MNYRLISSKHALLVILSVTTLWCTALNADRLIATQSEAPVIGCDIPKDNLAPIKKPIKKKRGKRVIDIRYNDEDLVNIINFLAAQKDINIVLPQGANAIKSKVTLNMPKKVSLDEAWDLLVTILDMAGYSVVPRGNFYSIVKTTKEVWREPMPLYVGTDFNELSGDQQVRYLHFLSNIKLAPDQNTELDGVLKDLLPESSTYRIDPQTNSILIMAPASVVASVMKIVTQLDQAGFQEAVEVIKLQFASAPFIADLFTKNILSVGNEPNRYRVDAKRQDASYFPRYTRIIADPRTNSLIILGRSQAIERIKDFIHEYLDVEPGSGKSILHVYTLEYLDATSAAEVLTKIVSSSKSSTGQSTAEGATGNERSFEGVLIMTDRPQDVGAPEGENAYKYQGGNKLIIAARNDDWKQLKRLLEELDNPQPQVLLEILIADLTIEDVRQLGSIIRNPAKIPAPNDMAFQAAHLQPGVVVDSCASPHTVGYIQKPTQYAADVLRNEFETSNGDTVACPSGADGNRSAAFFAAPGSTMISFNDNSGKTWGILNMLKLFDNTKVLSHPHVITTHNKQTFIKVSELRYVQGSAQGQTFQTIIAQDKITAGLEITLTPRIVVSSDVVNIQIKIAIDDFRGPAAQNLRVTRNVVTNAYVHDGDILSLGGFITERSQQTARETPVLSKVPILGWFFKGRDATLAKSNLTVFISPTIIEPRLRQGVGKYTLEYAGFAKDYASRGVVFEGLREPITRWFFTQGKSVSNEVDQFIARDEFKIKHPDLTVPSNRESKRNAKVRSGFLEKTRFTDDSPSDPFHKHESAEEIRRLVQQEAATPPESIRKRAEAYLQL